MKDLKIINEKAEPLYKRKFFVAKIIFEGVTPSREEVKKELSEKFKFNPDLMVVEKIKTIFGESAAEIYFYVYDDESAFKALAKEHLIKRDTKPSEEEQEG
ncbi:MAG: small subunit ribosomal protein S24e [Candidatus Woesearchaeota archaeon]|nr:small subunit ribosomal protein S24e [Candidatus Woesearchaeota archaeon]MDN5327685.1 small subunit ribosomal protein S24e [Candidatus Woesearchaeota archaeon]